MFLLLRKITTLLLILLLLASFKQVDTVQRRVDTAVLLLDSVVKKDTLMIQYVPIVPNNFKMADAEFLQYLHKGEVLDSGYNSLLDYKNYFADHRNAYKLYNDLVVKTNDAPVIYRIEQRFSLPDKDILYYAILALLFLYAFVANMYPQYFPKLFSQFSQYSLRTMQNREQLLQNSLASLLMNIGFILSFSLMATLLIFNRHLLPLPFWQGYLYISLFFTALYLGKFLCLQIAAYVFNSQEVIQTYIFVVFMINKVLGVLLLPFILILAFAKPLFHPVAIVGSAVLSALLILYRYLFSLTTVRNKLHISSFHFFLYLCAFEILPLLILYKLIVQYFGGTF